MNTFAGQTLRPITKSPGSLQGILQRQCACGNHSIGGVCAACVQNNGTLRRGRPGKLDATEDSPMVNEGVRLSGQTLDGKSRLLAAPPLGHDFSQVRVRGGAMPTDPSRAFQPQARSVHPDTAHTSIHVNGLEDEGPRREPVLESAAGGEAQPASASDALGQQVEPSSAESTHGGSSASSGAQSANTPATPPAQGPAATPCPTSVSVGAVAQRNHSNLSASEKENWRTELGAMSRMDVGPGPDHTGHCMKERLTTVSNNCPAAVYSRGGTTTEPCTGNRCLDINRYGSMWGVSDGPTAFLDMHRTRAHESLLEGTGVSACTVVCRQTYTCDRTQPTTGTFTITRNFQAGSHTRADGTAIHITTGTVTKT
jgi:hypothetical protein